MNVLSSSLRISEGLVGLGLIDLTTNYSLQSLGLRMEALGILTVEPCVGTAYRRYWRPSGDYELIKVALRIRRLWLGEQHVHYVQSIGRFSLGGVVGGALYLSS